MGQMFSVTTSRGISPAQKTLLDIKKKAHALYNKYIKTGSPFEVNIGYAMRLSLREKLEDKKKLEEDATLGLAQLIELFDGVKRDMRRYMVHSFVRLKSGADSEKLMVILEKDHNIINI